MNRPDPTHPADALERRYRRLLRTYPAAWRRDREEELIGVLMTAARPGRTRPSAAEALNLLTHGLLARLQAVAGGGRRADWPPGLGIAGVVLVVALGAVGLRVLVRLLLSWTQLRAVQARGFANPAYDGPAGLLRLFSSSLSDWPAWIAWTVTAGLVLAGRFRLARWAAGVAAAAHLALTARAALPGDPVGTVVDAAWALVGLLTALLLARPDLPRRGLGHLGRARLVWLAAVAAVALLEGRDDALLGGLMYRYPGLAVLAGVAFGAAGVLAVVGAAWLAGSYAGRRALVVLAAAGALLVNARALSGAGAGSLPWAGTTAPAAAGGIGWLVAPPLLALAIAMLAVTTAERALARRPNGPTPG